MDAEKEQANGKRSAKSPPVGPEPECPVGSPDNCPLERREDDPWRHAVTVRMDGFDGRLAENTALTHAIKKNTDEIVAFFEAGKGFFQVVRGVGIFAKWVTTIGAAIVIFWLVFKYGVTEIIENVKAGRNIGGGE